MSDTPKLLQYKPFTQSVYRVDTKSLKQQLKSQIYDLEDFSKQKAVIEQQLREKYKKLEAQEATFSYLESFSFYALKLTNYFYNQIYAQYRQICYLQQDVGFAKAVISASETRERSLAALLTCLYPNTAQPKWTFRRRLQVVKCALTFSVRLSRSGKSFGGTTVVAGVYFSASAKYRLGVQDILQMKYSTTGSAGAQLLIYPYAVKCNYRYKFETGLLHRQFAEYFSAVQQAKRELEQQNEQFQREIDVLNSRVQFLTQRQVELYFYAQEHSSAVEVQKFAQLHAANIALQQRLHVEQQQRMQSEKTEMQLREDILKAKYVISQQQDFALQNQELTHRVLYLEDALRAAQADSSVEQRSLERPHEGTKNTNHKAKIRDLSAQPENTDDEILAEVAMRTRVRTSSTQMRRLRDQYLGK